MLTYEEIIVRLLLSALLGSVIGLERERLEWAPGLRTHMLVSVGATVFMLVSAFGFSDILGSQYVTLDPSRIAAQVASGIGFLGAGTIIVRREIVRGLTTAASLWVVAAIGLAIGGGLYIAALCATAVVLLILGGLKPIERRLFARRHSQFLNMTVIRSEISLHEIDSYIRENGFMVRQIHIEPTEERGRESIQIAMDKSPNNNYVGLINNLHQLSGIIEIKDNGQ